MVNVLVRLIGLPNIPKFECAVYVVGVYGVAIQIPMQFDISEVFQEFLPALQVHCIELVVDKAERIIVGNMHINVVVLLCKNILMAFFVPLLYYAVVCY